MPPMLSNKVYLILTSFLMSIKIGHDSLDYVLIMPPDITDNLSISRIVLFFACLDFVLVLVNSIVDAFADIKDVAAHRDRIGERIDIGDVFDEVRIGGVHEGGVSLRIE